MSINLLCAVIGGLTRHKPLKPVTDGDVAQGGARGTCVGHAPGLTLWDACACQGWELKGDTVRMLQSESEPPRAGHCTETEADSGRRERGLCRC